MEFYGKNELYVKILLKKLEINEKNEIYIKNYNEIN
mgnify:CR=1 FL=1